MGTTASGLGHALSLVLLLGSCGFPNYQLTEVDPLGSQLGGAAAVAGATATGAGGASGTETGTAAAGEAGAPPISLERGCTDAMTVCLRMDQRPEQEGWSFAQSADASAEIINGFAGNHVMLFRTVGAEGAPGPMAAFSWTSPADVVKGRLLFDFRLAQIGPYTRIVVAEVDLGQRALRFLARKQPQEELVLQLQDRSDSRDGPVLEEVVVPEPSFFQQMRLIELTLVLGTADASASVVVEGTPAGDLLIGNDWLAAPPTLRFGAVSYDYPTSGAEFELDNLGFDPRP